ncbi:hypothetical protein DASC09_042440 [Saccharomycopsis crataegensis]|uniref:Uncharacterized protein n=1 Tax=Saccharomycopsis crataegensis TaxID=43959 RepID=A0AAV5QQD4_9ASCO|nr:hypothetical protein DASC09_042440 [Saccharomycopsis crataegensis]
MKLSSIAGSMALLSISAAYPINTIQSNDSDDNARPHMLHHIVGNRQSEGVHASFHDKRGFFDDVDNWLHQHRKDNETIVDKMFHHKDNETIVDKMLHHKDNETIIDKWFHNKDNATVIEKWWDHKDGESMVKGLLHHHNETIMQELFHHNKNNETRGSHELSKRTFFDDIDNWLHHKKANETGFDKRSFFDHVDNWLHHKKSNETSLGKRSISAQKDGFVNAMDNWYGQISGNVTYDAKTLIHTLDSWFHQEFQRFDNTTNKPSGLGKRNLLDDLFGHYENKTGSSSLL